MADMHAGPSYLRVAWLVFRKDFTEELRRRESLFSAVFVALLSVVLFRFALDETLVRFDQTGGGLLWLVALFAGSLFMGNVFRKETESGTLDALLLCPVDRSAVFLGKVFVNMVFLVILGLFLWALAFLFLDLRPQGGFGAVLGVWALVSVGYAVLGTLFAALVTPLRGGAMIYPVLLFPVLTPLFMGAVRLTDLAIRGEELLKSPWLRLIGGFDILFFIVALALFEPAVED